MEYGTLEDTSKNGLLIIRNYLTGGLFWYGHISMHGRDYVVQDELYEGTAKSTWGVLADKCYEQAKTEGCKVKVVWQDGDSIAAISVSLHHPTGKVYKCGGRGESAYQQSERGY